MLCKLLISVILDYGIKQTTAIQNVTSSGPSLNKQLQWNLQSLGAI